MRFSAAASLAPLLLLIGAGVHAQSQTVPGWFDPKASVTANAESAERAHEKPEMATRVLITTGGQPTDSVREVVKAYQSCNAMYSSVGEGVKQAPKQAGAIASAVISLENCVCGAEEMWAKARMEGRVRGPHRSPGIALSLPCTCAAATAEAVTAAMPSQADAAFNALANYTGDCQCNGSAFAGVVNGLGAGSKAWVDEQRKKAEEGRSGDGPGIVDVIGQVSPSDRTQWRDINAELRVARKFDDCNRDENKDDKFDLGKVWEPGTAAVSLNCSREPKSVLLREYIDVPGKYQTVQIDNPMKRPLDFGGTRHVLEVYVGNKRDPERIIPLTGTVDTGKTFLVASSTAPREVLAKADMVVPDLNAQGTEAVVLRRMGDEASLACPADVLRLTQLYPEGPIQPMPLDPLIPDGEPRTDESPIDPNKGGEIASPH